MSVLFFLEAFSAGETITRQTLGEHETHFTPVVVSVLSVPYPAKASDGLIHFVYELHMTNATGFVIHIDSVEVLEATQNGKVLAAYSGEVVPTIMQGLITKSPTDTLEAGEGGIIFIHFTMEKAASQLLTLAHRLTISGEFPPGFKLFMRLPASEKRIVEIGGITGIYPDSPILIGPPLEGNWWIAADGCCTAKRHIRAIMPINGQLRIAQRFAIDWELMNEERRLYAGDPSDVKSYFAYGQKVLAVADSTVVAAVDKYEDQEPGKLPSGITLEEADGNHVVLDLGNGQFAFYAHLQPGSITAHGLKVGDRVCRGQVLGFVGNSGNTTAPHLHFHVMASPSTLGSNGLPYLIDEFKILGKVPSTDAFDKAEQEGSPLFIQKVDKPEKHSDELPLDLSVVSFPARQDCGRSPEKHQ